MMQYTGYENIDKGEGGGEGVGPDMHTFKWNIMTELSEISRKEMHYISWRP